MNNNSNELTLDELEKIIYDLIQNEYNGIITRYTLEGILLYTYDCSHNRMYRVIMELILNEKIILEKLSDGEYYKIV